MADVLGSHHSSYTSPIDSPILPQYSRGSMDICICGQQDPLIATLYRASHSE